eukprot:3662726-Rhodomonas_salina.5
MQAAADKKDDDGPPMASSHLLSGKYVLCGFGASACGYWCSLNERVMRFSVGFGMLSACRSCA